MNTVTEQANREYTASVERLKKKSPELAKAFPDVKHLERIIKEAPQFSGTLPEPSAELTDESPNVAQIGELGPAAIGVEGARKADKQPVGNTSLKQSVKTAAKADGDTTPKDRPKLKGFGYL